MMISNFLAMIAPRELNYIEVSIVATIKLLFLAGFIYGISFLIKGIRLWVSKLPGGVKAVVFGLVLLLIELFIAGFAYAFLQWYVGFTNSYIGYWQNEIIRINYFW